MLVTCPECGAKISEGANPCPKCGLPEAGICSQECIQRSQKYTADAEERMRASREEPRYDVEGLTEKLKNAGCLPVIMFFVVAVIIAIILKITFF